MCKMNIIIWTILVYTVLSNRLLGSNCETSRKYKVRWVKERKIGKEEERKRKKDRERERMKKRERQRESAREREREWKKERERERERERESIIGERENKVCLGVPLNCEKGKPSKIFF